jgi:ACGX-repeat protein
MALANLAEWNEEKKVATWAQPNVSACGSACGAGDEKKEEKPAACGSACGAGDEKKEEKPSACGSACGAGDGK